jgi:hypothetical protein
VSGLADADVYSAQLKYKQQELARRSAWKLQFEGVDCTEQVMKDLLTIDITDNESESTDDIQIKLADADGKWVQRWLTDTIYQGASVRGLKIEAWVGVRKGDKIVQQKAGTFHLDSLSAGGPPGTVTMKASSLPPSGGIADEKRNKAWEEYTLAGIAGEIAGKAGLSLIYDAPTHSYERREQNEMTDLAFLRALCREAGIALKITDGKMVLMDSAAYANQGSVMTIRWNDGSYTKWSLQTGSRDISYDSCIVRYAHPEKGLITGSAESEKYADNEEHNQLVITNRRVETSAEAQEIAAQELRLKNDFGETATFTLPGNPAIMAGHNVTLEGFGYWDGKHPVKCVKHKLGSSGYTTDITLGGNISQHLADRDDYTLGSGQMVRIGTVTDVNEDKTKARVKFTSQGIISDWLYVAQFPEWGNINSEMYTEYASHKHHIAEKWGEIKDSLGGQLQGDETDWDGGHSHRIRHIQWFPRVNDKAICLFPSGSDSHGYIVGCINQ